MLNQSDPPPDFIERVTTDYISFAQQSKDIGPLLFLFVFIGLVGAYF